MNAKKLLTLGVVTFVLLAAASIIWIPLVPIAMRLQEATAADSTLVDEPSPVAEPLVDDDLEARVAKLESVIVQLDLTLAVNELQLRVAELERSSDHGEQVMALVLSRSQSSDISQLKGEMASLKRAYDHLATRMSMMPTSPAGSGVLRQRVNSLESTVRRLESGR